MAFVYAHLEADTGNPFYIGMGEKKIRPWQMNHHSRSGWHRNVVKKHGVRVEIIADGLDWETAQWWEIKWIKAFRDTEYRLVNQTNGGDGTTGISAHNKKNVVCLETGEMFSSATDAAIKFGLNVTTVTDVCKLKYRSAKNYHFVFSDIQIDELHRKELIKNIEDKCALRRKRVKINKNHPEPTDYKDIAGRRISGPMKNARPVYSITDNISFSSASSAARYYNVSKSAIIELCLGKNNRKSVGGIAFKYIEGA